MCIRDRADSMNEVMENAYTYNYDRSQVRQKREKKEIGISAVRGGTIVGEHEVDVYKRQAVGSVCLHLPKSVQT